MARILKILVALAVLIASCLTAVGTAMEYDTPINRVAAIAAAPEGWTYLASYDDDAIRLRLVDARGVALKEARLARQRESNLYSVADMAAEADGLLYVLYDLLDPLTGAYRGQEFSLYDLSAPLRKRVATQTFDGQAPVRYRWISVSSAVTLMGLDSTQSTLIRESYDPAALYSRQMPSPIGSRSYPLTGEEGIWKAVVAGSDVAYASKSGKIFLAAEDAPPKEVYPNRVLTELMYPLFISSMSADTIYIGEQESGNMLTLNLRDGSTQVVKSGTEPFSGVNSLAPINLRAMSMVDSQNFSALAPREEEGYCLVSAYGGTVAVVEYIVLPLGRLLLKSLLRLVKYTALLLAAMLLVYGFFHLLGRGRTVFAKLVLSSIPLLAVALVIFGFFSYRAYADAIEQSFQKQVEDEGNLLTALFGTESFDEIEFPYDYTGEAYAYLKQQMSTRPVYTATAYYEHERLYVGVDFRHPCFYPFDLRLDSDARNLYLRAAFTGSPQSGVLSDADGRRLVSVTPVGGTSGKTVYLLETGILMSNLKLYTGSYLRAYILVSLLFLGVIGALLSALFMRVLSPIRQIRAGLEAFAQGDRSVRLETEVSDEFSGIVRVFNKMAGDIDAQIYSLERQSETYFRFIPQRMLRLLGKDNLGDVELGSGSGLECPVLLAGMEMNTADLAPEQEQALTNRFFNIINKVSGTFEATLMTDSVNLRHLRVVCPGGAADAVEIALGVLSELDSFNTSLPVQNRMRPLLVIHSARVYYGICGDQDRLVPALLSEELDFLSSNEPQLRQLGCRMLVTQAARGQLPEDRYASRFIGYPERNVREAYGLYDFYDACAPEVTRLLNETGPTFQKAMALYLEGRFSEAKNLFALVLRGNQYDDVSRYYVFLCEKNL